MQILDAIRAVASKGDAMNLMDGLLRSDSRAFGELTELERIAADQAIEIGRALADPGYDQCADPVMVGNDVVVLEGSGLNLALWAPQLEGVLLLARDDEGDGPFLSVKTYRQHLAMVAGLFACLTEADAGGEDDALLERLFFSHCLARQTYLDDGRLTLSEDDMDYLGVVPGEELDVAGNMDRLEIRKRSGAVGLPDDLDFAVDGLLFTGGL